MNQKIIYVIKVPNGFVCDNAPFTCSDINDATHYRNAMAAEVDINSAKKHIAEANTFYSNDDERSRANVCVDGVVKKFLRTVTYCEVNDA